MKVKISILALFAVVMLSACGQQTETATAENTTTPAATTSSTDTATATTETPQTEPTTDATQAVDTTPAASQTESEFVKGMVDVVPYVTDDQAQLQQISYDFMNAHPNLFAAKTSADKQEAQKLVDSSVTSRHLFKNVTPYLDKMIKVTGTTIEVTEEETAMGTMAFVHIMDEYDNSLTGVYMGSTGDLLDGDEVTVRGVPLATYSFDNVGGGTTNAVLLALSTVQKEQ